MFRSYTDHSISRGRVSGKAHVFLTLCLRLGVELANHYRAYDDASPNIMLREQFCAIAN